MLFFSKFIIYGLLWELSSLTHHSFIVTLMHFDARHYLFIAQHGYTVLPLYVFFPLFSLLIYLFHFLCPSYLISALIINIIVNFLTGILLLFVAKSYHLSPWWMLLFYYWSPIAVYTTVAYTEALFLFLTLLSWWMIKTKRFYFAGVAIGFASLTRNIGFVLLAILFLQLIAKKEKKINIIRFFIPAMVLSSLYPLYSWVKAGSPLQFSFSETSWMHQLKFPWVPVFYDLFHITNKAFTATTIMNTVLLLSALLVIFITIKKKEWILSVYLLIGTIIPLMYPVVVPRMAEMTSLGRYIEGLFPMYIFPAFFSTRVKLGWLILSLVLSLIYLYGYAINVFLA